MIFPSVILVFQRAASIIAGQIWHETSGPELVEQLLKPEVLLLDVRTAEECPGVFSQLGWSFPGGSHQLSLCRAELGIEWHRNHSKF